MTDKQPEPQTEPSAAQTEPQTEPNAAQNATIEPQGNSAAGSTAEDTLKAYEALFNEQKKAIEEQKKRNDSLQNQINILIRNGAHTGENSNSSPAANNAGNPALKQAQVNTGIEPEPDEPYVSLSELGHDLGKREYKSHNTQRKE